MRAAWTTDNIQPSYTATSAMARTCSSMFHPECLAGDVFGSSGCDCGNALRAAVDAVAAEGRGIVVYLRHSRNLHSAIGATMNRLRVRPADHTMVAAQILLDLGVRSVRTASDESAMRAGLEDHGL